MRKKYPIRPITVAQTRSPRLAPRNICELRAPHCQFTAKGKIIRIIVAAALTSVAIPALAENKCQYGSWNEEVLHIGAMQGSQWQYHELRPDERQKVVERYWADAHEKIDYPHAWVERSVYEGLVEYSVIFTDNDGCIQFRLNVTGLNIR